MALLLLILLVLLLPCLAMASKPAHNKLINRCVVVGSGPCGLSLALALDKLSLFDNINVLERRSELTTDATKAYLYLLDGRSKEVLEVVGVWDELSKLSVSSKSFTHVTEIGTSGTMKQLNVPVDATAEEKLWLPRDALIGTLINRIANNSRISIHYNHEVTYESVTGSGSEDSIVFDASGFKSDIAGSLVKQGRVLVYERDSDSAGLFYKILSIDSSFKLPNGCVSDCEESYVFRSKQSNLNLGLLPVKRDAMSSTGNRRTANIIMNKNSPIWKISDSNEMRRHLAERFPQLQGAALDSLVSNEEMERFTKAKPGRFPKPRCLFPLYDYDSKTNRLITLCGDAAHAFPPDIGQGVNSALQDVMCIYKAAQTSSGQGGLFDPIAFGKTYDHSRRRSHRALIDIMTIAFPYQYNQNALKKNLAYMNFAMRLALNKICPKLFSKPLFFLVQNSSVPYERALELANRTTRNIFACIVAVAALVICKISINRGALFF